ncbi:response regulator transcription factor [Cohnella nanjingensis]|uniref:Helix-turn-helix domain-containing protein n=1 Tax=Cohnella nanjingensis TaxID=1387779 RepID=A0A7X0RSH1_9BACL|nr:helix-turn-helix domain-containing protein [Cohnella nanjingensis]MBB6671404.1 helix-turn-helix domain-containing protein [Cohnella nanjingensis]
MIRALIVDDELYAVQGLRSGVRWEEIGVDEVYEAYHASMAEELLISREIDIMICDIEMPEGSALELMAWVNERKLAVETVVLTCHSEFAYAQRAIQLGGNDYLLKPVVYGDLEQVLLKAIRKVEDKRKATETDELYQKYAELWNSRKPILVERFWQDLFARQIRTDLDALAGAVAAYDMRLETLERVVLVLVSVEEWRKPLREREEEIMEFALRKAAEEIVLERLPGHVVRDHDGNTFVALCLGESRTEAEEIAALCRRYIEACNQYFYCSLSCYVGDPVPVSDASRVYLELLNAEYRNVSRTNEVLFPVADGAGTEARSQIDARVPLDLAERIGLDGTAQVLERLNGWLESGNREPTVEMLNGCYHAVLQAVYYALHRKGHSAHLLYGDREWPDAQAVTRSVSRFKLWAAQVLEAADVLLHAEHTSSPVVAKVKAYIAAHMARELSREELAAHVYLNPAYLSRLFRKETGMVLTDYILQEKMRRASDLLAGTDRTVSEIADGLGYGNFSYFARLFRKVYGVSPHDYRKSFKRAN